MKDFHRDIYDEIRKHPGGISRRSLQRRFGVSDPNLEDSRRQVWRISDAVASLLRDRFVVTDHSDGEIWLYPQMV